MIKASAITTKMAVASIIAVIKQCRYYKHTGYKIIMLKFIAKENNSKILVWVPNPGNGGSAYLPLKIRHWLLPSIIIAYINIKTSFVQSIAVTYQWITRSTMNRHSSVKHRLQINIDKHSIKSNSP